MSLYHKKLALVFLVVPLFLLTAFPVAAWGESIVWALVVNFLGFFAGVAGMVLDYSAMEFVVHFGSSFQTSGTGVAVDILWVKVRDLFNLTFIFGLVFIGLKMILNSDDSSTRRWLISLIMAALLVNFSLFITKLIIDITNLLATQIAQVFTIVSRSGGSGPSFDTLNISSKFLEQLGVNGVFGGFPEGAGWSYVFGSAIICIIMMFVFFSGAILIIIRYAVLCIYMVLSPLMFLGWVFPQFASVSKKYWSGFLGRAFFAPIYFLLLYFSFFILQAFAGGGRIRPDFIKALQTADGGSKAAADIGNTWPFFFLVSVFMIASVVAAQQLGIEGGSGAVRMMQNVKNNVQTRVNRAARATGRAAVTATGARHVARRGSYALGRGLEKGLQRMQRSDGAVGSLARIGGVDRAVRGAATATQGARFGLQNNLRTDRAQASAINARYNRDADMALSVQSARNATDYSERLRNQKLVGSQMKQMSAQEKANLGRNNLLEATYVANLTDDDLKKFESEGHFSAAQVSEFRTARNQAQIQPALDTINVADLADMADPEANGRVATQAERDAYQALLAQRANKQAARQYLDSSVKGMSNDTLLQMAQHPTQSALLTNREVAQNFTDGQLNQLESSGMNVGGLRGARNDAMTKEAEDALDGTTTSAEELEGAFDKLSRTVKSLSGEKLTGMGIDRLSQERIAMNLSDSQIDSLQNSGQYTNEQIKSIKEARKRGQIAIATGDHSKVKSPIFNTANANTQGYVDSSNPGKGTFVQSRHQALFRNGTKAAGALPPDVFADESSAPYITPTMLEERMNNYMTQDEIDKIRLNMQEYLDTLNDASIPSNNTPVVQAKIKSWKQWARTSKGSWLGLNIP